MKQAGNLGIIGIGGTNGSGKDSLGHMLADYHKYFFISVTELLRQECLRRGLPVEREHLRTISAEWRREYGLGVLMDKAMTAYEAVKEAFPGGIAISSLRNSGEADRIHELGGTVVWMDADPRVRYERIVLRQRSSEDQKSFEEFVAEEEAEMHHSGDAATLDVAGVKEKSDITIHNDGNDITEFNEKAYAQLFGAR